MSAAKRNTRKRVTPQEVRSRVEGGAQAPCYLLHGEEGYGRERFYRWLLARLRPEVAADFNVEVFHGDSLDPQRVLDVYFAYPMMAPQRLVAIRAADRLGPPQCKALEPLIDQPAETSVLIVEGGKLDLRRRLYAQLSRQGVAVEFRAPFENQLPEVIAEMAVERGLQLAPEAVDRLRLYVGPQLADMANELDKLSLYLANGSQKVTAQHVEEVVGASRGASVFDFTDAVGRADRPAAAALLHALLEQGEEPNRILPLMARHLQLLLKTQRLELQRLPKEQMARSLGISPFFLSSYRQQAGRLHSPTLWRGLSALRRADDLLKSGGGRERYRAIMDLCLAALIRSANQNTRG